jgi:hypothetical protein
MLESIIIALTPRPKGHFDAAQKQLFFPNQSAVPVQNRIHTQGTGGPAKLSDSISLFMKLLSSSIR